MDRCPRGEWRGAVFLGIVAFRHFVVGMLCLIDPQVFDRSAFHGVLGVVPIGGSDVVAVWGVILLLVAGFCLVGALARIDWLANAALTVSIILTGMWIGSMVAAAIDGTLSSYLLLTAWTVLALKDAVFISLPKRNGFAGLLGRLAELR